MAGSLDRPWSAADLAHAAGGSDEVDLADGVARPLLTHVGGDRGGHVVVGSARPQDRPQVGLVHGEQAVAELAVGGEPHPVAAAAEGLADAVDDAYLPLAVEVAPHRRRLAPLPHGLD